MDEDNQQKNTAKTSQPPQVFNISGDMVYGDKVGNDKIGGDKINKANQNSITEGSVDYQTPKQIKKKTSYLGISIIAILIAIVLGIVIWQINLQQADESFVFQVRVQDHVTTEPISNAQVTLDVEGESIPKVELTDSNGFAVFYISSDLTRAHTNINVNAEGYQIKLQIIQVEPDQLPFVVNLKNKP